VFKKYFDNTNQMKILGRLLGSLLAIMLFMFVTPLQMAYAAKTPQRFPAWISSRPAQP